MVNYYKIENSDENSYIQVIKEKVKCHQNKF